MKSFSKLTAVLAVLFFIGCGGDSNSHSNSGDTPSSDAPLQSIFINTDEIKLRVNKTYDITLEGIDSKGLVRKLDASKASYSIDDESIAAINYNGKINGILKGNATLNIKYNNLRPINVKVIVSSELNTSNINKAYFGNLYLDTIPDDSTLETYDERLFAMITGKVLDEQGQPLKDVTVSIHKFGEYGTTKTDENGSYAIPVEGARKVIVRYSKQGYTTIDRDIYAKVQDWTITPDVNMLKKDTKVSEINLTTATPKIHASSKVIDDRGERQTTLVFEGANSAKAIDKNGNERELNAINVRATEFKIPSSMPSNLPDTTAFTYCADITVDGVKDDESVVFDNPLVMYVDNFLGFNVGVLAPIGYYDRNRGEWVGSNNGIVVRLLDTDNDGKIDSLDANGDNNPDDLNDNGDFNDEVIGIADNSEYQAGKTYWRGSITHFTPWDFNWAYVIEGEVVVPSENKTQEYTGSEGCQPSQNTNSYITSKTQVLHDDINIIGADVRFHYSSQNTGGYKYTLTTAVDTSDIPSTAAGAQAIFEISGKRYEKTLNFNQLNNVEFEWDGKDAMGNQLSGAVNGKLTIRYKYRLVYTIFPYIIGTGGYSEVLMSPIWGLESSTSTGIVGSNEYRYYQVTKDIVIDTGQVKPNTNFIANGWSIEDDLYMNLNSKGTLSNANTQKYIEVKDGMLFAVDNEPENRLTVDKLMPNRYYALALTFPSATLYYSSNTLDLITFSITDKLAYENTRIKLGRFTEFNFIKNYYNTPEAGYDSYAYYRGTEFEGAREQYLGASVTPWELKDKIRYGIDNDKPFMYPTNDNNGDMSYAGSYWVFIYPTELLYKKVDDIYPDLYPDYTKVNDNNHYFSQFGLTKTDIIIFNSNLGYVYDTATGLLKIIFDNTQKQIIRTYEHDSNNKLISITDQFGNKITVSRDYEGNPTSITAPNGQITRLSVNYKGDLTSITYEDSSAYSFDYDDNSLLTSKTTPNSYRTSYYYDDKGRVIRQIDTNNGEWRFSKAKSDKSTEYSIIKPEGDKLTYFDTKDSEGNLLSSINLPSGYSYNAFFNKDETISNTTKDNVRTITQTMKDPLTLNTIPKSQTITMPSGLKKTTTNEVYYDGDIKNILSKTQRITTNSKITTITDNYQSGSITITSANNIKSLLSYDKTTLLPISSKYANLELINYSYDDKGRLTKASQGTNTIDYTYDTKGNIKTIKDAKGQITSYEYDSLDRVDSITYPNNIQEHYSYDKEGNVLRYTTPKNTNFDFTYNSLKQRLSLKSPLNKTTLYSYNKNRDLTQITYPSAKKIEFIYDNSLLKTIKTSNNDEFTYKYSFHNKIDTITRNNNEKISYEYDGELMTKISQRGVLNQDILFSYNNDFNPTSITYSNIQDTYVYNSDNLLTKAGSFNIQRDSTNSLTTKIYDNTYTKEYSYDTKGNIQTIKDNSYQQNILSRYENNNIKSTQENANSIYEYTYDNLNRLIKVSKDNNIIEEYSYDNQGNRLSSTINGQTTTYSYNNDDELISKTTSNVQTSYSYNQDGQLTSKGTTQYSYDAFGNLKEVILPNNTKITYMYNANNQRTAKLINNQIEEKYLWLNLTTLLAVYDKDDNIKQRFTYIDERTPISYTDKNNNIYYLSYNHQGTLKAITNENNQILKELEYDSFGNIINETYFDTNGNVITPNPNLDIPFTFAGGLYDKDTKLIKFGYRDYDPNIGRWITKDPIDFEGGDSNLYGYVLGDPVNFVDAEGLNPISDGINYVGGFGGAFVEFWAWSKALDDAPSTVNIDKFYHCMANCRSANLGQGGKDAADILNIYKETFDHYTQGQSREECLSDFEADYQGLKGGNCFETCSYEKLGVGKPD